MRKRAACGLIFLTLVLCLFTAKPSSFKAAASSVYPVHNLDTGYNYTTIQEAINDNETLDGQKIFVEKGVYYENVACSKNLTLIGEDKDATIIDGNGMGMVVQLGSGASITNFTIRNGDYGVRTGPLWYEIPVPQFTGNSIINNIIRDNVYGGILLWCSANNTVAHNTVANNTLFGIDIHISADNLITSNTVTNNGHGIDFYSNSNGNVLRNNNLTDNGYNFGLLLRGRYYSWIGGSPSNPGLINDVDASNTINGKPIYYWVGKQDAQIPLDAGFVWLNGCNNITIRNLSISDNIQGILLLWTNNTLVDGNTITDNAYGIVTAYGSRNNTLLNNVLVDNVNGVYLGEFSTSTVMKNNSISGGRYNFGVSPWEEGFIIGNGPTDVMGGLNYVDDSNTVDGKPIVYWIGQHDLHVPSNAGCVMLINCTNIAVEGLSLSNNLQNVLLLNSNNTLISNNTISDAVSGVWVRSFPKFSSATISWTQQPFFNITIKGNTFLNNGVACKLEEGDCLILNNTLYNDPLAIYLQGTSNSVVAGNVVVAANLTLPRPTSYSYRDLYVFYYPQQYWELSAELNEFLWGGIAASGDANVIYDNTVEDSYIGIATADITRPGVNDVICHNNLINNTFQALDPASKTNLGSNRWDLGYPSGGNYWSDYNGTDLYSGMFQNESGSDGIADAAYSTPWIKDNYPLMTPYTDLYDIAIAYPLTSRPVFKRPDETINVSISVINLSLEAETFNVTLQANYTTIAAFQNISLAAGKSASITYEWNVTGLLYGAYLINASITPVPSETRLSDNTRALLIIHTIPGDLNEDGTVNSGDATILADQFGSTQNQPTWVPNTDINGDGEVDILDAIILANNFGRTW